MLQSNTGMTAGELISRHQGRRLSDQRIVECKASKWDQVDRIESIAMDDGPE